MRSPKNAYYISLGLIYVVIVTVAVLARFCLWECAWVLCCFECTIADLTDYAARLMFRLQYCVRDWVVQLILLCGSTVISAEFSVRKFWKKKDRS